MRNRNTLTDMLLLAVILSLAAGVRAQDSAAAPSQEVVTVDRALQEALTLVRTIAEGGDVQGDWADAAERMDRYVAVIQKEDPDNPWLTYLYGWIYAIGGQRGDAIDQLEKFVQTREGRNEWRAYRLLGDLLVEQFPRLARAYYEKAADLVDREASVLYGLSRCAMGTGDMSEAIRLAREAVEADRSNSVRYLSHLARLLMHERRWDEAQRTAESALERALGDHRKDPSADRPLKLADLQYQLLIDIMRGRINESPTPEAYVLIVDYIERRASIALKLQRFEMLRLLEAAIDLPGGDSYAPLFERYAVLLAELGRKEEAIRAFDHLLKLDPSNAAAKMWMAKLRPQPPATTPTDQP